MKGEVKVEKGAFENVPPKDLAVFLAQYELYMRVGTDGAFWIRKEEPKQNPLSATTPNLTPSTGEGQDPSVSNQDSGDT